jgi:hypothetical protein
VGTVQVTGTKTVTVAALEAVPGKTGVTAFRLRTVVPGSQLQDTWQELQASTLVRHRDDVLSLAGTLLSTSIYSASKMRFEEGKVATNDTYADVYSEVATVVSPPASSTKMHTGTFVVINSAESVTVPAGTFVAVHVQRQKPVMGTPTVSKDYWFVRGVGKVKETSASGRVEQLRTWSIP